MIPTRRTSQPSSGGIAPLSNQNLNSRMGGGNKMDSLNANREENSDLDSVQNHAQNLRKVSEQLLNNPRTRQSFTGGNVALPGVGIPVMNSRPGSLASPKHSTATSSTSAAPSPVSKIPLSSTSSSASSRPSSQMSGKMFPSSIPAVGSSLVTRKSSSPSNANTGNI